MQMNKSQYILIIWLHFLFIQMLIFESQINAWANIKVDFFLQILCKLMTNLKTIQWNKSSMNCSQTTTKKTQQIVC